MRLVREALLNPIALSKNKNGASFRVAIDCSIEVEHIDLFEVTSTANEHTRLTIECLLSSANAEIYEDIDLEDKIVKLLHIKETGKETLFAGYIECVEITFRNNLYYIIIKAVSASKNLAGKEKSRSFQDLGEKYTDIVRTVLDDNNAMAVFSTDKDIKIPFPIIQYEETDWNFIKRLASHFNVSVFPESISGDCNIYFGMKKSKNNHDFSGESYRVGISERFYKLGGEYLGLSKRQFLTYNVRNNSINAEIGDTGFIKGQPFRICEKKIHFDGSELMFFYLLADEIYTTHKNIYNDKLAGVSIHGTVLETSAETLKLHLEIDEEQDKTTAYNYKWVPETGNLMYLMPQIGTNVSLYFYNSSEGSGEVINCVRTNGGDSCPKMSDPNMRQLKTEYGNHMLLYPELTGLVSGDVSENQSFVTVDDNEGIIINSHKGMFLSAKEKICLKAPIIKFGTPERTTASKVDFAVTMAEDGSISSIDVVNTPSFIVMDMGSFYTNTHTAIMSGSEGTAMPKIDDAPKEGEFDWGKLALGVVAGLAVVAVAVILAPVAIAGAVAVAGCVAVGGLAASNISSGNVNEWYEFGLVAVVGCVVGAIGAVVYPLVATGLSTALGATALSNTAIAVISGVGAGVVSGGTCGFLGSVGNQFVLTGQVDMGSAGRSALTGAIGGGVFGGIFGGLTGGTPPTWPETILGGAVGGAIGNAIDQGIDVIFFDGEFDIDKVIVGGVMGAGMSAGGRVINNTVTQWKGGQPMQVLTRDQRTQRDIALNADRGRYGDNEYRTGDPANAQANDRMVQAGGKQLSKPVTEISSSQDHDLDSVFTFNDNEHVVGEVKHNTAGQGSAGGNRQGSQPYVESKLQAEYGNFGRDIINEGYQSVLIRVNEGNSYGSMRILQLDPGGYVVRGTTPGGAGVQAALPHVDQGSNNIYVMVTSSSQVPLYGNSVLGLQDNYYRPLHEVLDEDEPQ